MADGNFSDVNAIKAEFSFGLHVLPVSLLVSPEEKYRARAAKQENVDGAVHRLLQFGNVNEHVVVVLFVGANTPLPEKSGFKPPVSGRAASTVSTPLSATTRREP